ncbi:hypothetical protein Dimus_038885 [Dionaea muscipula]
MDDIAEKIELEEVAALAAKFDEEDAQAEAAAEKAMKQKTYSRKRKTARKSTRDVRRKIILKEEETDEIAEEIAAEAAESGKELTIFHRGLPTSVAEPIVQEEETLEDATARHEAFTTMCAKFEQTIRSMIVVSEEQRNALREVWTELDKFTHFDSKLKAQMCSTLLRIEQNDEGRNECMMQTLDVLRILPKTLETHRDYLHNRIKDVVTTNLSNCQVIEKNIEIFEKNTDRRIDRLTTEMKELTENVARGFESNDERMKGVEKALIQIIATQEEHSRNQSELTSYFKDFLMDAKKGEEMFSKDGKSTEEATLKEFIEGSSTILKTFESRTKRALQMPSFTSVVTESGARL